VTAPRPRSKLRARLAWLWNQLLLVGWALESIELEAGENRRSREPWD
jgi:hypothetical protein